MEMEKNLRTGVMELNWKGPCVGICQVLRATNLMTYVIACFFFHKYSF